MFAFRLAREFKRPDVTRFLQDLAWDDFRWWMAYYSLEPWGEIREDLRAGVVASAVYNVNRTKQTDKVWTPADFVLQRQDPSSSGDSRQLQDPEAWQRLKSAFRAVAGA